MKKTEEEKNCGNCVSFPKEKIGNHYFCQNQDSPIQPNPIGKECYCHLHKLKTSLKGEGRGEPQVNEKEITLHDWQKKAIAHIEQKEKKEMKSKKELIEAGCRMLSIDGYKDEEVVPLEVKRIKSCLKIIIEQSRKK